MSSNDDINEANNALKTPLPTESVKAMGVIWPSQKLEGRLEASPRRDESIEIQQEYN